MDRKRVIRSYYNEFDPFKAEVIRQAIKAGAVAPGDVDERSIADVRADDLGGYTQCHFFAGGGFWSLALRQAGWPDDRPVWTGSCPCPSFSAAGKGGGFNDPRHLWPAWEKLIRVRKPAVIFGEQADDAIGYGWLDLVQTDLEAQAYAVGKIVLGTCSVGGADIRQRIYFVADSKSGGFERRRSSEESIGIETAERSQAVVQPERLRNVGILGDTAERGCGVVGDEAQPGSGGYVDGAKLSSRLGHSELSRFEVRKSVGDGTGPIVSSSINSGLADADGGQPRHGDLQRGGQHGLEPEDGGVSGLADANDAERWPDVAGGNKHIWHPTGRYEGDGESGTSSQDVRSHGAGPLKGFWGDCDWIHCRPERGYPNGRWRPVESGTFPLAHGDPCRLGRLRLYGDAINIEVAKAFVETYLDQERMI